MIKIIVHAGNTTVNNSKDRKHRIHKIIIKHVSIPCTVYQYCIVSDNDGYTKLEPIVRDCISDTTRLRML